MKERPILFSGEMVRAILAGNKSQTRRVIQFPRKWIGIVDNDLRESGFWNTGECWQYGDDRLPQNYQVGDRLWIRETWAILNDDDGTPDYYQYKADSGDPYPGNWPPEEAKGNPEAPKWRPSIFMPKDIARIWLEITGMKVERLQDISQEDARAEGSKLWIPEDDNLKQYTNGSYRNGFHELWDNINIKRGYPWSSNPWVWMIEFRRIER